MSKSIIETAKPSSTTYEALEEMVRSKAQEYIQEILEEEIEAFLGRKKSERIKSVEWDSWLPERIRKGEAVYSDERNDPYSASSSKGNGRKV